MWIEEIPNGKFKYNERYKDPYTDKLKKVSVTYTSKSRQAQKEAQIELNNRIDDILNNSLYVNNNITFGEVVDEWLARYEHQVKPSTHYAASQSMVTLKEIILPTYKFSKIDHLLLNKTFDILLYERNLSNAYVKIIKSRISQMYKYAIKSGYVQDSPLAKVDISYKRKEFDALESFFLEDNEYETLIKIAEQRNIRYFFLFKWLYLNGMRAGKALALTEEDIIVNEDRDERYASVNGTLEYHGKTIHQQTKSTSTKTIAGMRNVDLSKKSLDIIDRMNQLNEDLDNTFIFCTNKGTPMQISAINTFLRVHVEPELTANKKLSSHIFRHTHVSKLAELGVPLYAIQDRVGHESSDITEKIYLHITKDVRDRVKTDIEKL